MSNWVKHDIDWRTLEDTPMLAKEIMGPKVPIPIILVSSNTLVPPRSGRVVI